MSSNDSSISPESAKSESPPPAITEALDEYRDSLQETSAPMHDAWCYDDQWRDVEVCHDCRCRVAEREAAARSRLESLFREQREEIERLRTILLRAEAHLGNLDRAIAKAGKRQ